MYYCHLFLSKNILYTMDKSKPLEMYEFIHKSKPYHLTINDIKTLKPNSTLDVIIWDRNFEEPWIWSNAKKMQPYDPHIFFAENHHTLTYLGNMKWDLHFNFLTEEEKKCKNKFVHPVHIDVSNLPTNWTWVDIPDDGIINITRDIIGTGEKLGPNKNKPMHWSEFPGSTRVGWRGPIMLWEHMKKMPQVYYDEKAEPVNEKTEYAPIIKQGGSNMTSNNNKNYYALYNKYKKKYIKLKETLKINYK